MKPIKGEYSPFPFKIMKGRPPLEQVLLTWIIYHTDDYGVCWPTQELLEDETGMNARTIRRYIQKLEEEGLITVERTEITSSKKVSNKYTLSKEIHRTQSPTHRTECPPLPDTESYGPEDTESYVYNEHLMNSLELMNGTNEEKEITKVISKKTSEFSETLEQAISDFEDHRKAMKKKMTPKALEIFKNKIKEALPYLQEKGIIHEIEKSIEHGYQTILYDWKKPPGSVRPPLSEEEFQREWERQNAEFDAMNQQFINKYLS